VLPQRKAARTPIRAAVLLTPSVLFYTS
jgi:hypothetical protein